MPDLTPLFEAQLLGSSLATWLVVAGVATITYLGLYLATSLARQAVERFAKRTKGILDDALAHALAASKKSLLLLIALAFAALALNLPPWGFVALRIILALSILLQIALWGNRFIAAWVELYREKNLERNAGAIGIARVISFVARLALFSILFILALDNLPGVEVTTLVAGLGIGGIAVALAVQNILADLFASVSIALDQPFVIGDFIVIDEFAGTVDQIGLKTTRLKSLSGEQLIFANTDLLNSRIRNFKRMSERRIVFTIGVTYETPRETLRMIPDLLRNAVTNQPGVRFDRAHFAAFGDFSLNFEVVYFVLSPDYNQYMDRQQAINFAIAEAFAASKIEFAYPTQVVHLAPSAAAVPSGSRQQNGKIDNRV